MSLRLAFVSVIRPLFKGDSRRVADDSEVGLRRLGEELGFSLVSEGLRVSELDEAARAAGAITETAPDLLLIQHSTFATGELLAPLLNAARRVGVWAVPEAAGLPAGVGPGAGSGPLPLNALCGLNMTLSLLDHPAVAKREPVKWFYGEIDSEVFRARLMPTLAALRGLKALSNVRVLQIGGAAPGFYGLEESPEFAAVTVDTTPLDAFFARVQTIDETEVARRAQSWQAEEASEVSLESLERAIRVELALKALAEEGDYGALAVRCWPELPERCGTMACSSLARLGDHGLPAACEGDVMGALSMLALQGVSGAPALLMDLSDLDESDDSLLLWHCGNAPLSWAAEGARLTTHFNRDTLGVVRDMVLRPGPATGFRLLRGGKEALILSGRFGEPSKPSFDGVRGWFRDLRWDGERLSARGAVANLLDRRLPHHLALGEGELTDALRELCAWLGAQPLPAAPERLSL